MAFGLTTLVTAHSMKFTLDEIKSTGRRKFERITIEPFQQPTFDILPLDATLKKEGSYYIILDLSPPHGSEN